MILATTKVEDLDRFLEILGCGGLADLRLRPEVPAILQEAGHKGKPQAAELGGKYDA